MELRTHCIAVRSNPHEIRENMVPPIGVTLWVNRKDREGWTTMVLETRRVPILPE